MELLGLSIASKVAEIGKLNACFYSDSTGIGLIKLTYYCLKPPQARLDRCSMSERIRKRFKLPNRFGRGT
jgi:hypothetical protein